MSSHASQPVPSRLLRFLLPRLVLGGSLALVACDGGDNQLAPDGLDQPLAAGEAAAAAAPDLALTAATAQRIVFTSYRKGNAEIFKMDPLGANVVRLTNTSAEERQPALSYDNKRIAMMRPRQDIGNVTHTDIWILNTDGTGGHWARPEASPWNLKSASWSPDGSRLVMTLVWTGGYEYLATMTLADGQISLIHPQGGGIFGTLASYDHTGQKIVYVNLYTKSVDQINADGTNHKVLYSSGSNVNRPVFSPDGKKIAFSRTIPGFDPNEEIYVKNLVTQVVTRLTSSPGPDFQPTWSPDGSRLAFTSRRSGQYQIWTMSASGGAPVRLTQTSTIEAEPVWYH
jgi:Tol biopolymer transport system component